MKRTTAKATPRPKRKRVVSPKDSDLHRRSGRVQNGLLRDELRASETAPAAGSLRALNQRQAREGVERLRIDLKAFRDLGIVDEHGKRVRRELPAEMVEEAGSVI